MEGPTRQAGLLQRCKQQAAEHIDRAAGHLHHLSDAIWSRPELAFAELRAHETLTGFFAREGWAVQPHYKLETAFRADWLSAAPEASGTARPLTLCFMCEYDALPDIGHACGHNLIAEVGAAAALGLRAVCEKLPEAAARPIKITVLGTPAEEDGGGKINLIEAGALEDIDVAFMAHPGQDDAPYLPDCAEHDVIVKYYGKCSHAAAYPWEGINALDAAVLAYNNLSVLRQQLKPTWRVHGIIKNGGLKPNIIPSYSELEFYLRAPSRKDLLLLQEKSDACFKAAAVATGCTVEIKNCQHDYYNVLPNKTLAKAYRENGKMLGMDFTTDELVLNSLSGALEIVLLRNILTLRKIKGSTDFGNVTFVVPGIHPYFYIGTNALNHTQEYTEAAGSKEAQFYTLRTAKALAMTALDVVFKQDLLEKAKADFRHARQMEEDHFNGMDTVRESSGGAGSASR